MTVTPPPDPGTFLAGTYQGQEGPGPKTYTVTYVDSHHVRLDTVPWFENDPTPIAILNSSGMEGA